MVNGQTNRVAIHYLVRRQGEMEYRLACAPELLRHRHPLSPKPAGSDDARAVTCPLCLEDAACKRIVEAAKFGG